MKTLLAAVLATTMASNVQAYQRCTDGAIQDVIADMESMGIEVTMSRYCSPSRERIKFLDNFLSKRANELWYATQDKDGVEEAIAVYHIYQHIKTYGYSYGYRTRQLLR